MILINCIYKHKKSGRLYKVIAIFSNLLIQYEKEWLPSVVYRVYDSNVMESKYTDEYIMDHSELDFIRSQKEFLEKFEEVKE